MREIIYSDLDLNFLKSRKYGVNIIVNEDAIKQQIKNLVLISTNEFLFNDDELLGSKLYHYLFEPLSPFIAISISHLVETVLKNNVNRVKNIKVETNISYEDESYILNIYFTPYNSSDIEHLQIILKRIR